MSLRRSLRAFARRLTSAIVPVHLPARLPRHCTGARAEAPLTRSVAVAMPTEPHGEGSPGPASAAWLIRTRVTRLLSSSVIVRTSPSMLRAVPSNCPIAAPAVPKRASSAPALLSTVTFDPSPT